MPIPGDTGCPLQGQALSAVSGVSSAVAGAFLLVLPLGFV